MNRDISLSPDMIAWNRARLRRVLELVCAITAGLGLMTMFVVFYSILTR
jgi:hypothetical protein